MDFRAAEAQLADARVGQKRDVLDALFQLVESREAAPLEGSAIGGGLYALRLAVEQPYTEGMLEIGNYLGNGWLGNSELLRRLGHASEADDR